MKGKQSQGDGFQAGGGKPREAEVCFGAKMKVMRSTGTRHNMCVNKNQANGMIKPARSRGKVDEFKFLGSTIQGIGWFCLIDKSLSWRWQ